MPEKRQEYIYDVLSTADLGMNSGIAPLLLQKNELANATNVTVRGDFIGPRSANRKVALSFGSSDSTIMGAPNIFQGMQYYKPDLGLEQLTVALNGRLFVFTPGTSQTADVEEIPITGGPNPATQPQAWMWQAEKWIIWNDGLGVPIFYDGSTLVATAFVIPAVGATVNIVLNSFDNITVGDVLIFEGFGQAIVTVVGATPTTQITIQNQTMAPVGGTVPVGTVIRRAFRSNFGTHIDFRVLTASSPTIPAFGQLVVVAFNNVGGLAPGDIVTITGCGQGQVTNIAGLNVTLLNISMLPFNGLVPNNVVVSWSHFGTQLPPGRMGVYGMGRNWFSLTDGRQFIASDIVGGPSGTQGDNFRDSVLQITENQYLVGGGNFAVPGSVGDIRAMIFSATLDTSLGQGALLVLTPNTTFSCSTPVDRITWQQLTNPILTESTKGNGGLGQWSTINVNSDIFFRAVDGIRTYMQTRRDFHTWSNTPISHELDTILPNDDNALLRYGSAVFFDNRMLMTVSPEATDRGVIHHGIVALNCDPVSTMRSKQPPVWDGLWTGLDILQMLVGEFGLVERCFAFCLNRNTQQFELWEIMPTAGFFFDNIEFDGVRSDIPIRFEFETPLIFRPPDPRHPQPIRLDAGEIFIDDMVGAVRFDIYWRPDSEACWQPWTAFSVCQKEGNKAPGYRQRLGLGEPPQTCEPFNDKPYKNGFWFQVKMIVTGFCSIKLQRYQASIIPDIPMAQPAGCCPGEEEIP